MNKYSTEITKRYSAMTPTNLIVTEPVKQMLKLQANLEDIMHPEWRDKPPLSTHLNVAIDCELAEVQELLPFKWWKNAKPRNEIALGFELCDVLFFILLQHNLNNTPIPKDLTWRIYSKQLSDTVIMDCLLRYKQGCLAARKFHLEGLFELMQMLNYSFDDIVAMYVVKYCVNVIRTKYAIGYNKMWDHQRDDVAAYKLARSKFSFIRLTDTDKIVDLLSQFYTNHYLK